MGKIILLNTPIGNLGDLTPRVLEALKSGTFFAAEDTRVLKELLNHLGIGLQGKRIISFHDQSGEGAVERLLDEVGSGDLYVVSDAGSPIISDPAYPLVSGAWERGIRVESYSGVSSPIMALELSGLPPIPFTFHGFLPREKGKKAQLWQNLLPGTHLFFEGPTRVEETLDQLAQEAPDAMVAVVRELSKKFEEVRRFKAGDWIEAKKDAIYKGEFVLVVYIPGGQGRASGPRELRELAQEILAKGASPKLLAKLLGQILERPTKDIYSLLNRI